MCIPAIKVPNLGMASNMYDVRMYVFYIVRSKNLWQQDEGQRFITSTNWCCSRTLTRKVVPDIHPTFEPRLNILMHINTKKIKGYGGLMMW